MTQNLFTLLSRARYIMGGIHLHSATM